MSAAIGPHRGVRIGILHQFISLISRSPNEYHEVTIHSTRYEQDTIPDRSAATSSSVNLSINQYFF